MKERILWIDIINIIACLGVVLLHCTNYEYHNFTGVTANWICGNFTHSFFLWPVNVFFMLTGYTLLSTFDKYDGNIHLFFKRRFVRIGIPLIVWHLIYSIKQFIRGYVTDSLDWNKFLTDFFLLRSDSIFWFFIPLIIIYITIPFIHVFVRNAGIMLLKKFLIIGFILICVVPALYYNYDFPELTNLFPMGAQYLFVCIAGYFLGTYRLSDIKKKQLYSAGVVSMLLMFVCRLFFALQGWNYKELPFSYTLAPCTLSAFTVFYWAKNVSWNNILDKIKLSSDTIARISSYSFGIYLIHAAFIFIFDKCDFLQIHIFIKFFLVYSVSIISVAILKRIPILKRVV